MCKVILTKVHTKLGQVGWKTTNTHKLSVRFFTNFVFDFEKI